MNKLNHRRTPAGVLMIAAFYLFGAVILLVSLFTNPVAVSRSIADTHGLSAVIDIFIIPIVAGIALLIAYGLLTLSRWGYFITLIYLCIFGIVNLWILSQRVQQLYVGNATWSILVLVYLIWKRKVFLKTT